MSTSAKKSRFISSVRITIKQLEYFIATAEVGSIKVASQNIHISQPSISSAISHLEKELQIQLFVRHHAKGLDLTMSGKQIYKEAKLLIKRAEGLYSIGNELNHEITGKLTVGCMITLAPVVMAQLGKSFTKKYPDVELSFVEDSHANLTEKLLRVKVDVAIMYDLQSQDEIEFTPLTDLPPHILISHSHSLANRRSLTLEQLESEPMVLLDLPYSRQYFLSLLQERGLKPNIAYSSSNPEMIRAMVANGFGYTIANIRPKNLTALDGHKLVSIKLAGNNKPMIMGLSVLSQDRKPKVISAFEQHCRDIFSGDAIPGMLPPL